MQNDLTQLIIAEFNLGELSPQDQQTMVTKLGEMIITGSLAAYYDTLSDEEADHVEQQLSELTDPNDMLEFMIGSLPGFYEVMLKEIQMVKEHTKTVMQSMTSGATTS